MAEYQASIDVNVGARASVEALGLLFSDVSQLLRLAKDVQAVADRRLAAYEVWLATRGGRELEGYDSAYVQSLFRSGWGFSFEAPRASRT